MDWLGRWSEPLLRGALAGLLGGAGAGAWAGGPIDATPVVDYLDHFQGRDGSGPRGGLILATDGNYYGTTFAGGSKHDGVVFRMTPDGALTVIHEFPAQGDHGPESALVQGADGDLYGTTAESPGGASGSIFRLALDGSFETLHRLTPDEGTLLISELVASRDGFLYGTAFAGGADGMGTVIRISRSGHFERLVSFPRSGELGLYPEAPLLEGDDGNFYGTTSRGGAQDGGTLFRMTPAGELTVLHDFDFFGDGGSPAGRLVRSADRSALLGVTQIGGALEGGTAYAYADGRFTKLADFDRSVGWAPTALTPGPDPATCYFFMLTPPYPQQGELMSLDATNRVRRVVDVKGHTAQHGPPTLAPDGTLLGVLESGGKGGHGGIFRISGL